jgi:tripartite-type tricarboxylate transporter receptor subunit TctC
MTQYPSKPVSVVVVFPPADGTDIVAPMIFTKLADTMKANFVIDNRGSAGGVTGTDIIAKSVPDRYTMDVVSGSHAINPALYQKRPYDSSPTSRPYRARAVQKQRPGDDRSHLRKCSFRCRRFLPLPYVKTGKLRALGVTSKKRSSILPDVLSLAEAGLPVYDATS